MKVTIISKTGIAEGVQIITEDGKDICEQIPVKNIHISMMLSEAIVAKLDLDIVIPDVEIAEARVVFTDEAGEILNKMGWVRDPRLGRHTHKCDLYYGGNEGQPCTCKPVY